MIKNIIQQNDNISPNTQVMDVLRTHFHQCFNKEGHFDMDKFKEQIKDDVDITHEGYDLNFLGKNYAKLLASLDTTTVIQPDLEHNAKPENANSQNLYISGDNLDGLKHLLKSYTGAIKCIYIDPPYNTGSDGFVYNDKFNFSTQDLIDKLSINDEQAQKILDLTSKGRASHSAWLTFMYPRLLLARDLLTTDGIIYISIDDNEQANLKLLCDAVFGEENFLASFIWKRRASSAMSDNNISSDHECVICYQRSGFVIFDGVEKDFKSYSNPDNDPRGPWVLGDLTVGMSASLRPNQAYDLIDPVTKMVYPYNPNRVWSFIPESMNILLQEKRVVFPNDTSKRPMLKRFKNELKSDRNPISTILIDKVGLNTEGTRIIQQLFEQTIFDYSKPVTLLKTLLLQHCEKSDIILDFFSGSATTAHAVIQLNSEDGGNRRFISVQLPEVLDPKNANQKTAYQFLQSIKLPTTLDFIGMERIRRAAKKIKAETNAAIDYGFKHYTLLEPSEDTIDKLEDFKPDEMFVNNDTLSMFGKETVLETWLVKDGYGFGATVQEIKLHTYPAYLHGKHLYFIESGLTENDMVALLDKYQQDPSFSPENIVVFGYSFNFSQTEMLRKNLFVLRDSHKNLKANFEIRY